MIYKEDTLKGLTSGLLGQQVVTIILKDMEINDLMED
jgi:hypothetical protein